MLGSDMTPARQNSRYNYTGPGVVKSGAPKPPQAQPQAQPPAAGPFARPSGVQKPQYIDINATEDAVNNLMAQGYQQGDQRYQMKRSDRAGLSRGRGQQFIAGQEAAQAVGKAAEASAQVRSEDQATNAKIRSDYEKAREQEKMAGGMFGHAIGQANWSRQFAEESANAQLQMAQQQSAMNLMLALMR